MFFWLPRHFWFWEMFIVFLWGPEDKIKKKLFELANNQDFILKKLETLENNFHSSQTTTNQKLDQLISKLDRY